MYGLVPGFQMIRQIKPKSLISSMGILAFILLVLRSFILPSRITLSPPFPTSKIAVTEANNSTSKVISSSVKVGQLSLLTDSWDDTGQSLILKEVENVEVSYMGGEADQDFRIQRMYADTRRQGDSHDDIDMVEDMTPDKEISFGHGDGLLTKITSDPASTTIASVNFSSDEHSTAAVSLSDRQATKSFLNNEALMPLQNGSATINSTGYRIPLDKEKQVRPMISILEMNRFLLQNHAPHHSKRPRWYSSREKQILAVKTQIENAPIVKNDHELYAPIFRNISMFKRSYELMVRTLKVYIYKEGAKPIFHQPLLKGIYASEGWFMKLMENSRRYVVKDPRKAHLFYMPFSSRLLQFALYIPNSHNHRNLEQFLKNYINEIAAKYPFWNRTGGADHFLAACHDWAPYETRHTMKNSIRALCNADLSEGFQLGKDVSLPEIYIRSARNPLRDLGGMPANERPTLAFYAGNVHGRLRPILLRHWENRDPEMKIFGPMPPGVESKMAYIRHMKSSKYCICPRGYEVNSPRVVESIYYECVPVIISDNYVPPFFEVLNWDAFSVIIPEGDVPRLKEILVSIPKEKYLSLQKGVRMVQQHFLWHHKPVKYDLFHMILHSIWFNRLYQI